MNCCPKEGFYVGRCYYDYRRICGHCGGEFGSDHCKLDGVQATQSLLRMAGRGQADTAAIPGVGQ